MMQKLNRNVWVGFSVPGSRRRTKRWLSSSSWSSGLWSRSSKSHRVSDAFLVWARRFQTSSPENVLISPQHQIPKRPRDRSQSLLPTNPPSSSQWPSSRTAAVPPSVLWCNQCPDTHVTWPDRPHFNQPPQKFSTGGVSSTLLQHKDEAVSLQENVSSDVLPWKHLFIYINKRRCWLRENLIF